MLQPAPVQTLYTRYLTPAQNGMLASSINFSADTRTVETSGGIGFGLAVSQGVNDDGCIVGGSAIVGITRADITILRTDQIAGLVVDTYPQYDNAGVLITGDLWVFCYGSVAANAAVTYDTTTGKLGAAGTTIAQAKWMTTAAGSAGTPVLAVIRLGNPAMPH